MLVKKFERKTKLVLPDKQARRPDRGVVVAVGPGTANGYPEFQATTIKPKDKILFVRDRALEVELLGESYYILQERDALGVLDEEETR